MSKVLPVLLIVMLLFTACQKDDFIERSERDYEDSAEEKSKEDVSVIVFEAEKENLSADEMETVATVLRTRLDNMGYTEADVSVDAGGEVQVEVYNCENLQGVVKSLEAVGKIGFYVDRSDDTTPSSLAAMEAQKAASEILNGSHIKDALVQYGATSDLGSENYYVQLELTEEGRKAFYEATSKNVGRTINIILDGEVISSPIVQAPINDTTCIITGDFTQEEAKNLAASIKSGQLPVELKIKSIISN